MIYVTISTYNRFWHAALTALSMAQASWKGCFVHVLDDASDDEWWEAKYHLFHDLLLRRVIHRYERLETRGGFCAGRELFVQRFMEQSQFDYWFHLDDDILIGNSVVQTAMLDLKREFADRALLHVYANPWCKWTPTRKPFATVSKIGGACFVVPKPVMCQIGNPYTGQTDGERANAEFWSKLHAAGFEMGIRYTQPYLCQHTGNCESTIFGKTPTWEHMYAKDLKTQRVVEVPPFRMPQLRQAVKSGRLQNYVWQMNSECPIKVKLPSSPTKLKPGIL